MLFTHPHADHLLGLDDIRRYNTIQRAIIPCYGSPRTLAEVRRVFAYAFDPLQKGGGVPRLALFPLLGPCSFGPAVVTPVPVLHGRLPIYGYRIGSFAYVTDCSAVPEESWPLLEGVRVLALDALNLHVKPGEVYCLLGANGAGKTTPVPRLPAIPIRTGTRTFPGSR